MGRAPPRLRVSGHVERHHFAGSTGVVVAAELAVLVSVGVVLLVLEVQEREGDVLLAAQLTVDLGLVRQRAPVRRCRGQPEELPLERGVVAVLG